MTHPILHRSWSHFWANHSNSKPWKCGPKWSKMPGKSLNWCFRTYCPLHSICPDFFFEMSPFFCCVAEGHGCTSPSGWRSKWHLVFFGEICEILRGAGGWETWEFPHAQTPKSLATNPVFQAVKWKSISKLMTTVHWSNSIGILVNVVISLYIKVRKKNCSCCCCCCCFRKVSD